MRRNVEAFANAGEILRACAAVSNCRASNRVDEFLATIRQEVRSVLPHEFASCGLCEVHTGRILKALNIDFPVKYLRQAISPGEDVANWPLRAWIHKRSPVVFYWDQVHMEDNTVWSVAARARGITSCCCHGVSDINGAVATYFEFSNLDRCVFPAYEHLLTILVPHLHEALIRLLTSQVLDTALSSHPEKDMSPAMNAGLTERECQVLQWIATGKSNWEIGKILRISEFTVKSHVQSLLKKMGVKSRTQAVTKAIFYGLISGEFASPSGTGVALVDGGPPS